MPAVFEDRGSPVPAWFLENEAWFDRGHLYGTSAGEDPENGDRFSWF